MKKLLGLALLLVSSLASAATFPMFAPSTGILVGNANSYLTTAATFANFQSLLTGTCNSTALIRGDGLCTPFTTGTVTSVGLSAPSVFNVSGSPGTSVVSLGLTFATGQTQNQVLASPNGSAGAVALRSLVAADIPSLDLATKTTTTLTGLLKGTGSGAPSVYAGTSCSNQFPRSLNASGAATCNSVANADLTNSSITINGTATALGGTRTLALASADFANNGTTTTVLHGNAAGNPAFGAVSLTADVSGTLGAGNGGLGITTVTDDTIAIANGTVWQSKAVPACLDTAGNHLNYDNSTNTISCGTSGSSTFANPSGLIGLTAVNGVATTGTRSDATHALSQAIVPTMTGQWTFNLASGGVPITLTGQAATTTQALNHNGTSTSAIFDQFVNTTGQMWLGLESSTGNVLFAGAPAYAGVIGTQTNTSLALGTNGSARVLVNGSGNVTVNAPSSGTAMTVNGVSTGPIADFNGGSATSSYARFQTSGTSYGDIGIGQSVVSGGAVNDFAVASRSGDMILGSNSARRITIANAGNVTIAAPSSGTPLTVNRTGSGPVAIFSSGTYGANIYSDTSGTAYYGSEASANNSYTVNTVSNSANIYTNGVSRATISSAGNVTVNAPSSGTPLTVNGTGQVLVVAGGATSSNYFTASNNGNITSIGSESSAGGSVVTGTAAYSGFAGTLNNVPFSVAVNGAEKYRFGTSGQLGIGGATYGTSGQVFTSQGPSAAPSWTTVATQTTGSGSFSVSSAVTAGCSAGTSATYTYVVAGRLASVTITQGGGFVCTSNSTNAFTFDGFNAAIIPTTSKNSIMTVTTNNSAQAVSTFNITNGGTGTFNVCSSLTSCSGSTGSGSKGVPIGWTITYSLD